jgi:hypothetical protein
VYFLFEIYEYFPKVHRKSRLWQESGPTDGVLPMPLINLVVILIVVGVLLWLVNNYIPMDSKIKSILNVVVVIGVVLWLLQALGMLGSIENIRIGR